MRQFVQRELLTSLKYVVRLSGRVLWYGDDDHDDDRCHDDGDNRSDEQCMECGEEDAYDGLLQGGEPRVKETMRCHWAGDTRADGRVTCGPELRAELS